MRLRSCAGLCVCQAQVAVVRATHCVVWCVSADRLIRCTAAAPLRSDGSAFSPAMHFEPARRANARAGHGQRQRATSGIGDVPHGPPQNGEPEHGPTRASRALVGAVQPPPPRPDTQDEGRARPRCDLHKNIVNIINIIKWPPSLSACRLHEF